MTQPTKLMIMAGGTGGHVFPALAVAHKLQAQGTQVTWLGTRRGLEARIVPADGIDIEWITIEGLRGKSFMSQLLAPIKLLRAMWQSASVIRRIKPDCVLGMGGFVSGPGGLVARLMRRPLIVHEQNAVAGLTNQYLAKFASRVLTGFPAVAQLPGTAKWVGNPVRDSIVPGNSNTTDRINVLIIGGSQGAFSFNTKLPAIFGELTDQSVSIHHQCGRGNVAAVTAAYAAVGINCQVSDFINDMADAYQWADLLICRAGAMTIAECCAAAKPAILIPYPYSAGDHQAANAQVLVDVGAGRVVANEHIDQAPMRDALTHLLKDKSVLRAMGKKAGTLHKPNAADEVAAICREYLDA